jgi:heptosyltransferase III
MRLLVYHAGALGDFVTFLPALRLLRASLPGARLVLLGRPTHGQLAADHGLVEEVVDVGSRSLAPLYAGDAGPASALLAGFDGALAASASRPLLAALAACVPWVVHHPPFPETEVSAYRYHAALAAEAIGRCGREKPLPEAVALALEPPLLGALPARRRPVALIHPGSGSPAKTWPAERFAEVADGLRGRGLDVAWSLGPSDEALEPAVNALAAGRDAVLRGAAPAALASALSEAALYIGMDSGVSHLAAAVGCPSVIVFGPTSPEVWCPPGGHVRIVLRRGACGRESPDGVGCSVPPRGERCARKQGGVASCIIAVSALDLLDAAAALVAPSGAG